MRLFFSAISNQYPTSLPAVNITRVQYPASNIEHPSPRIEHPVHKHQLLKSQMTSTPPEKRRASKSQTNYKFQYPMTKILIGSFFDILSTFEILNFGYCDLFGI